MFLECVSRHWISVCSKACFIMVLVAPRRRLLTHPPWLPSPRCAPSQTSTAGAYKQYKGEGRVGVCVSSEALMGMRHWILSEAEQGGCHHGVACLGPLKGSRRLSAAPKGTSRESMSLATWIRCVTVRLSIRSAPSLHAPPANRNATPPSSPQPTVATAKRPRKVHAVRYTTAVLSSSHRLVLSSCVSVWILRRR